MTEINFDNGDPIGNVSLYTFLFGFALSHVVEFHDVIEVVLDVVLVGVGLVSIINGVLKLIEKVQEWKTKNRRLRKSRQ